MENAIVAIKDLLSRGDVIGIREKIEDGSIAKITMDDVKALVGSDLQGVSNLSYKEIKIATDIGDGIALDLFQQGVFENRKEDAKLIRDQIIQCFNEIKQDDHEKEFTEGAVDALIGKHTSDFQGRWSRKEKDNSLSQIYYDNTKYTTMGLMTGGIYMPKDKINDKLKNKVKLIIKCRLSPSVVTGKVR